jgi:hypothetical protein
VPWDEKIAYLINALFGAALGIAIYLFGLGGFRFLLMSRPPAHWWSGWLGFCICVGASAAAGAYSYKNRHAQLDLPREGIYEGKAGGELLVRRLFVIGGAVVAIYYIWQLAKSI